MLKFQPCRKYFSVVSKSLSGSLNLASKLPPISLGNLCCSLACSKAHACFWATWHDRSARRVLPIEADYVGFLIPDRFVIGYGLDYAERYRNLPDICILAEVPSK